jgi:hypothetical protein
MTKKLSDFHSICFTDKLANYIDAIGPMWRSGHDYAKNLYDFICPLILDVDLPVLEVGVLAGHSHLLWSCYFPENKVYGIDIQPPPYPEFGKVKLFQGDAYSSDWVNKFTDLEPGGFKMVVDDGPHTLETQQFFVEYYWLLVAPNGWMVVEDCINDAIGTISSQLSKVGPTMIIPSACSTDGNLVAAVATQKLQ